MTLADTITNLGSAIINLVNSKIANAISANNTEIKEALSDLQAQIDTISGSGGWGSSGGFEVCDIGMALYIDESKGLRRWLNGQIVDITQDTQSFLTKLQSVISLYPSLACTEEDWQAAKASSPFGQVGKFVLNYASETWSIFETLDISSWDYIYRVFKKPVDEIAVGDVAYDWDNDTQQITDEDTEYVVTATWGGEYTGNKTVSFEASGGNGWSYNSDYTNTTEDIESVRLPIGLPNITAGNSDLDAGGTESGEESVTAQEQIQYPYFIQIATSEETKIEFNNPFTLFDSKYTEAPLYNVSWLLSNGEYYSKSVYVTAYEALVIENNAEITAGESVTLPSGTTYVKRCLSVKLSTDEDITDYDFVINTSDETFRLPLKNGMEGMFGGSAVVGNGYGLGLTCGTSTNYVLSKYGGDGNDSNLRPGTYSTYPAVGASASPMGTGNSNIAWGVSTDPETSGLVVSDSGEVPEGWSLYYYVGETT